MEKQTLVLIGFNSNRTYYKVRPPPFKYFFNKSYN